MKSNELKAARMRIGISQRELAKSINMSNVSYRKKENGNIEFKRNEIKQLAIVLKLSNEDIINIFFN